MIQSEEYRYSTEQSDEHSVDQPDKHVGELSEENSVRQSDG